MFVPVTKTTSANVVFRCRKLYALKDIKKGTELKVSVLQANTSYISDVLNDDDIIEINRLHRIASEHAFKN